MPMPMARRRNILAAVLAETDRYPFSGVTDRAIVMAAVQPIHERPSLRPVPFRAGSVDAPTTIPLPDLPTLTSFLVQQQDPIPRRRVPVPDHQPVDVVAEWWLLPLIPAAVPDHPLRRRVNPPNEEVGRSPLPLADERTLASCQVGAELPPRRLAPRWQPPGEHVTFWSDIGYVTPPRDDSSSPQYPRRIVRPVPQQEQDWSGWTIGLDYKLTVDVQTIEPRQVRFRPFPAGEQSWCPPSVQIDIGASRLLEVQAETPRVPRRPMWMQPQGELVDFWSDTTFGAVPDGDDAGMSQFPRRLTRPTWLQQPHDILPPIAAGDVGNSLTAFVIHVTDPMPRRIVRTLAGELPYTLPPGPIGPPEESVWLGNLQQDIQPVWRPRAPIVGYDFYSEPPWAGAMIFPTTAHAGSVGVGYVVLVGQMFCPGAIVGTLQETGG